MVTIRVNGVSRQVDIEPDTPEVTPSGKEEKSGDKKDKKKSKDYWQAKFKSVRADLAQAEEAQKLVQDEIDLLKMRQVQEPSADAQTEINAKLTARQSELETATTTTDQEKLWTTLKKNSTKVAPHRSGAKPNKTPSLN